MTCGAKTIRADNDALVVWDDDGRHFAIRTDDLKTLTIQARSKPGPMELDREFTLEQAIRWIRHDESQAKALRIAMAALKRISNFESEPIWSDSRDDAANSMVMAALDALIDIQQEAKP